MPKNIPVTMRVRVGDAELEVTGPHDFVEKKIAEFLKLTPMPAHISVTGAGTPPSTIADRKLKAMSPGQFFKTCNPKTDADRVLVGAYFLEKFGNAQNATVGEIKALISGAKRPPPSNTNDAASQNIRKGFLMTAGDRENKMTFVVTSDGEAAVEAMMGQNKE